MTKNKNSYEFLQDFSGVKFPVSPAVNLYNEMSGTFLAKIGSADNENDRAEAGRYAYRVMRGLQEKGFDYYFLMQNAVNLELQTAGAIKIVLKTGEAKVVKLG